MKLAIATGILAQALPTFSQKNVNLIPQERHDNVASKVSSSDKDSDVSLVKNHGVRRYRTSESMLANLRLTKNNRLTNQRQVNKQYVTKYCKPTSNDPDVGILSCGPGMFCTPSEDSLLGGRCEVNEGNNMGWSNGNGDLLSIGTGSFDRVVPTVECDPASTADVGILSCGDGERCVTSTFSTKGGFCMQSSESRRLQTGGFGMCDPTSNYYMFLNCDCSGYDVSSGSGEIPCSILENYSLGLSFPGCRYTYENRTVRYHVANATLQAYTTCFNLTSATTTETFCLGQAFDSGTCALSINSQPCNSCTIGVYGSNSLLSFDCTNVGGVVGNTTQSRSDFVPSIRACYVTPTNTNCTLCTAENTVLAPSTFGQIVTVGALGDFSCYSLFNNEYKFGPIGENYCSAAASAASGACCDSTCNLCGEGNYIPPGNTSTVVNFALAGYQSVTCGDLIYAAYRTFVITGANCQAASSVAQSSCCAPYRYETCNVCDGPLVNPFTMVSADGLYLPCNVFDTVRNDTLCNSVKPQVFSTCCTGGNNVSSPSPSPISDPAPFPAPVEAGEEAPVEAPVSAPVGADEEAPVESPSPEPPAPSGTPTNFPVPGILSTLGLLAVGVAAVVMN